MRLIVCGGRRYGLALPKDPPARVVEAEAERQALLRALDKFHSMHPIKVLMHGDAPGADTLAGHWAFGYSLATIPFAADWQKYGKRAGPLRNARMLEEGKPDAVLAFPGGRGTADMVRRAKAAGVPVWHVDGGYLIRSKQFAHE